MFPQLSPRQNEVLSLVVDGYQNKQIAIKLGIAQQSVANHLKKIYKLLEVRDRTQAAVKWVVKEMGR